MSNPLAYDPSEPINSMIVNLVSDSLEEQLKALWNKTLPNTLLPLTVVNSNFRDALLHHLTDSSAYPLEVFVAAVKSMKDDNESALTVFSEYGAALAYASGDIETAINIVLRNPSTTHSSLLKNIAEGITNGMSGDTFRELLRNSTAMAATLLVNA
jgi:RNAse (barnase) inhibitor barstar